MLCLVKYRIVWLASGLYGMLGCIHDGCVRWWHHCHQLLSLHCGLSHSSIYFSFWFSILSFSYYLWQLFGSFISLHSFISLPICQCHSLHITTVAQGHTKRGSKMRCIQHPHHSWKKLMQCLFSSQYPSNLTNWQPSGWSYQSLRLLDNLSMTHNVTVIFLSCRTTKIVCMKIKSFLS